MSRRLADPLIEVRTTSDAVAGNAVAGNAGANHAASDSAHNGIDPTADIDVRTIDVRRVDGGDTVGEPTQFLWRGRLYVIRSILARWTEAGSWWLSSGAQPSATEREVWRVEATPTRGSTGVYDLVYEGGSDHWALARVVD